jgi:hypothetical protein
MLFRHLPCRQCPVIPCLNYFCTLLPFNSQQNDMPYTAKTTAALQAVLSIIFIPMIFAPVK